MENARISSISSILMVSSLSLPIGSHPPISYTQAKILKTHKHYNSNPPPSPWFPLYTLLEALFHLPFTLWAIPALLRSDPRLPLALLVFSLETTFTTLTCMAEMLSWEELSAQQRGLQGLGGMYGGYLALGVFMAVDCYARLDQVVAGVRGLEPVSKKEL